MLTCNVNVSDAMNITATFNAVVATGGAGGGSTAATLTEKHRVAKEQSPATQQASCAEISVL